MGEGTVQVQPDAGGKRVRTRERTIGGVTIEEQYVISLDTDRVLSNRYFFHTGVHTVQASAQTGTTGFWYLFNPSASAVIVAVRRISFRSQLNSALATPTAPRVAVKLLTGTTTSDLSASLVTPAKQDSTYAANTVKVSTASTGITSPTAGATVTAFFPTASATAVGYAPPAIDHWQPDADLPLILRANEGIFLQQIDNATSSDTRLIVTNIVVDEFTWP